QRGRSMRIHTAIDRAPTIVNTSVSQRRYLTSREVERLIEAARKHGRYGHRDATMILIAYRHGLRASELCDLQWHQIELNAGRLHVRRSQRRNPRPTALATRAGGIAARLRLRARRPDVGQKLRYAVRALRQACSYALPDLPAHAAPRLRLCTGKCRSRH